MERDLRSNIIGVTQTLLVTNGTSFIIRHMLKLVRTLEWCDRLGSGDVYEFIT